MTTPEKPAEFRPADNYDTNPYYDENFDHSTTNPFKEIDGRLDALETTVDTAETGLSDRVEALETTVDTASTGLSDRVEALETTVDTAETGLVDRVSALENAPEPSALIIGVVPGATESDPMTLDKNWGEIEEAVLAGRTILASESDGGEDYMYYPLQYQLAYNPSIVGYPYAFVIITTDSTVTFIAQTRTSPLTQEIGH